MHKIVRYEVTIWKMEGNLKGIFGDKIIDHLNSVWID